MVINQSQRYEIYQEWRRNHEHKISLRKHYFKRPEGSCWFLPCDRRACVWDENRWGKSTAGFVTIVLNTDDIQATYEAIISRGIKIDPPKTADWGGKELVFHDPDGNIVTVLWRHSIWTTKSFLSEWSDSTWYIKPAKTNILPSTAICSRSWMSTGTSLALFISAIQWSWSVALSFSSILRFLARSIVMLCTISFAGSSMS